MNSTTEEDRWVERGHRLPFPPEVFLRLCSFLSPSDARSLRLCCKALAKTGACYGFRNIHLWLCKPDFEMLRALSCHPIISKNIKKLTYHTPTLIYPDGLYHPLHEFIRLSMLGRPLPHYFVAATENILEKYRRYEITAQEQLQIVDEKEDVALFEEVLPKLTCLEEITIDVKPYGSPPHMVFADLREQQIEQHAQALMHGLSNSGLRLRSLEVMSLVPSAINATFLQQILPACKYLKSIDITFYPHNSVCRVDSETWEVYLPGDDLLEHFFKDLRSLECIRVQGFGIHLRHIVHPDAKWNNLREVELNVINTERHELVAFFERHRLTLEIVTMEECILATTSVKILLFQMKEVLKLKELHLHGAWNGRFEDGEDRSGFTNSSATQGWQFGEATDRHCLGMKVADWFLHDAPCPLQPDLLNLAAR
ncbi:hypothetical protein F4805DRAFT_417435 [Annulohypoxylon moriforme]|nr:hypothetical protein F4805DRAFT_417435 [Annulohypoxylon moriforme]